MFKAISSGLSFLFILLILKVVFPDIAFLIAQIIIKALMILNNILDQAPASIGAPL